MKIEYGTIASRITECTPVEWMDVQNSLVNDEGVCFFRPDFGFLSGLTSWFRHCGMRVDGDQEPDWQWLEAQLDPNMLSGITLRDYQLESVRKALCHRRGIVANATASGKTPVYAAITKLVGGKSVCVFDTTAAAEQMAENLRKYGVENVGMIGGGKKIYDDHLMVVSNSAYIRVSKSDPRFVRHLQECSLLGFDEVHHLGGARTWLQVCLYCPAPYRIGLSATPFDDAWCTDDLRLLGAIGPVISHMPSKPLRDQGYLAEPLAIMVPVVGEEVEGFVSDWLKVEQSAIVAHEYRNNLVKSICTHIVHYEPEARVLCLVRRQAHGRAICKALNALGVSARFSFGGKSLVDEQDRLTRRKYSQVREEFEAGEFSVLLGSVVYDESQDMPSITDLVLAGGGKKLRRLKQRLGRGERRHDGKTWVRVWDFYDSQHKSTERHSQKRLEGYEEEDIFVLTNPKMVNDLVCGRVNPGQLASLLMGDGSENHNQQDRQVCLPGTV